MIRLALLLLILVPNFALAADVPQPAWGKISPVEARPGVFQVQVEKPAADGKYELPTPFPHLIAAAVVSSSPVQNVPFEFNTDASKLILLAPADLSPSSVFELQTAEESKQFGDGRIVLNALDAKVHGKKAKLEKHPGSYRIGFWSDPTDYVAWNYNASRWGMYRVVLTYSTASPDGTEIEVDIAGKKLQGALKSTGSWYRYTTLDLGNVYLDTAGAKSIAVKCLKPTGGAVMNLKAVTLYPACEGNPPVQAQDGSVTLHGRDATVHGVTLRYEPAEKKQTLGYWVKPEDSASWDFTVNTPGEYEVEVLQGCGGGQGGSDMTIRCNKQEVSFQVEETGHFQNFKPRNVGRVKFQEPGIYSLAVGPKKIAKSAACDIRQIRLLPVAP